MTEEEKKAIETLEEIIKHKDDFDMAYGVKFLRPYSIGIEKQEQLEIALNLIKKLQKENEELRQSYDKATTEIEQLNNRDIKRLAEIGELRTKNSYLKQENEYLNCICESDKDNYINKGKIREKIKELENGEQCYYEFSTGDLVDLLKILLEESE